MDGTVVIASNGNYYQCISNQVTPWCNSSLAAYYAPSNRLCMVIRLGTIQLQTLNLLWPLLVKLDY